MSSTIPPTTESAGAPSDAEPRWPSRPRRRPMLVGSLAGFAALAVLIAVWAAVPASARSESPDPDDDGADVSYEQCVDAALAAFGPVEEASSEPSEAGDGDGTVSGTGTGDPLKSKDTATAGDGAVPDPLDDEEVHPDSPAHEMCTEDCAEDEQCARPTEFIVVRDDNVETISFENPEPEGDPAG